MYRIKEARGMYFLLGERNNRTNLFFVLDGVYYELIQKATGGQILFYVPIVVI